MKKVLLGVAFVVVLIMGACRFLLPERFAVNAPIGQMLWGRDAETPAATEIARRMRGPKGSAVEVFAEGIANARWLRFTETGDLLVTQPRRGRVLLVFRDQDGDGRADGQQTLLDGLNRPHGMDLRDGWLYVGETDAVGRIRFDAAARAVSGSFERVVTGLPGTGNHWSRTVRFGPDGLLYVSVGSSCNVCIEEDERRAAILRFQPDGSDGQLFATGLRNAVGFDWQPGSGDLYATDNGRDLLGNDFPPCELNLITEGGFYGWPIANGDRVEDPDLGAGEAGRIAASIPPAHPFRAHNAPLGIAFVRSPQAPDAYRGAALVALHGSWNRTEKDGYKVVSLHWGPDGAIEERDFAVGFLVDDDVIGRPVDVAEGPDGAVYISDDYAGVIWRVAWDGAGRARAALPPDPREADPLALLAPGERAELAQRGRDLWDANACATCHDPDAAPPGIAVRPLANLEARYDVDGLTALLETPPPPMPIPGLERDDRRALAVHLLETF